VPLRAVLGVVVNYRNTQRAMTSLFCDARMS
jgi:hypothetical protein